MRAAGGLPAALFLLALAGDSASGFGAGGPAVPQSSGAGPAAPKAELDSPPTLAEILVAVEELEASERRLRPPPSDEKRLPALAAEIDEIGKTFSGTWRPAGDVTDDVAGFRGLVDLGSALREAEERLASVSGELVSGAKSLDTALDRVAADEAKAARWMESARTRNAPPAVRERIEALIPLREALARELLARRDRVLDVLDRATRLHGEVSTLLLEVSARRDRLATALRTERGDPIWRVEPRRAEWGRVVKPLEAQIAQAVGYARAHAAPLIAISIAVFALAYGLIVATRDRLAAQAETDPYVRRACRLFRLPAVAAFTAALAAVIELGPRGPFSYYLLLLALLRFAVVLLALAVIGPEVSLSLFALAGAAILQDFLGAIVDPLPLAGRLLLVAQCGTVAAALFVDLRRGRIERSFPSLPARAVRWVTVGVILPYAAAVLATVTGYLGAARLLRSLMFGALGLSILLAVAGALLSGLVLALMNTSAGRRLRLVSLHEHALRGRLRKALLIATAAAWVCGMLFLLGLWDAAARLVNTLYRAELTVGSTHLQMMHVWDGLAVLLGTIFAVGIVAPVLELEILPRLTRRQGLPFAIATLTRYLLVAVGLLLALAAMGIDLTRVSLLAGALGVGIGFGLQGLVNNFVSGLVLLLERPVNVGDVVQTGQLTGTIRRIGVRSSTVLTPQGAEVSVPNANLISNEVTNWTLSDRRRRLEIDVGAAYGCQPEEVIGLLEAAAREVAEVVAMPPPSASCAGFGESALSFRLEAWVDDYARGDETESRLRMAIVKRLRDAKIEIPLPQWDIHIRTTSEVEDESNAKRRRS